MKTCSICKKRLPLDVFYTNPKTGKVNSQCRPCTNKTRKSYYAKTSLGEYEKEFSYDNVRPHGYKVADMIKKYNKVFDNTRKLGYSRKDTCLAPAGEIDNAIL